MKTTPVIIPECPICNKKLPTQRVTERRPGRTLKYAIIITDDLTLEKGRLCHKKCLIDSNTNNLQLVPEVHKNINFVN